MGRPAQRSAPSDVREARHRANRGFTATRSLVACGLAAVIVTLAAVFAGVGIAGSPLSQVSRTVDTGLCPFPLDVKVVREIRAHRVGKKVIQVIGPSTITLRNASTGRTATLDASGAYSQDPVTGDVSFQGYMVWFGIAEHVPYLSTDGTGSENAPDFVLSGGNTHPRVIDPCALVAPSPPSMQPVTTPAPWGLPTYPLSHIAYAGLIPVLGNLVRHDHTHLDVIVDGKKVTIPAGVGLAEPIGGGPCPPGGVPEGDCATRHFFTAGVGFSPIHTHSPSGIIHIESDRPGAYTLGEFFDEWGVRLDSTCIGGYCSGGGKQLRVYVDGKRVPGDPRSIVLANHQEIAVVFGGPADFRSVPSTYTGGWPGQGCGGPGEHSCFP